MLHILSLLLLFVSLINGNPADTSASNLNVAVQSNKKFAANLLKNIGNKDNNLVISPLSAQLITEFVRLGAKRNTSKQIANALYLPETGPGNGFKLFIDELQKESDATIKIANRVYVTEKNSLRTDFQKAAQEALMADALNVDFSKVKTADDINNWVEQKTDNKIKDLVEPGSLNGDTSLLLINTLYFKASWDAEFDWESRKMFHKNDNIAVETDFLDMVTISYNDIRRAELRQLSARMLDIPYEGRKFRFLIILPDKGSSLQNLEERMANINLNVLLNKTDQPDQWRISIPKFKIESSIKLNDAFQKMGMTDMFNGGVADFTKMTNIITPPLYVSEVIQKTYIDINKFGTEAASATSSQFIPTSLSLRPPAPFVADRPFLFYLIHTTTNNHATVLFSGRFTSP